MASPQTVGQNIKYCGVARVDDKVIVASYMQLARGDANRSNAGVKNLLTKGQISARKAGTLEFEDGKLHYTADDSCAYFVSAASNYPSRTAFQMLNKFSKDFKELCGPQIAASAEDGLSKRAKGLLVETCKKFDDLNAVDKISQVSNQVDQVKQVMSNNIQIMLQNQDSLENLNDTTEMLTKESKAFQKKATAVKRSMCLKNAKMTAFIVAIVVIILIIIIVSVIPKR
eukprot:tig00000870_g5138.t1